MRPPASFLVADRRYFELPHNTNHDRSYISLLARLLPETWSTQEFEVWIQANPTTISLPAQGFKIHISATPWNAPEIIARTTKVCVDNDTPFKVVKSPGLLGMTLSKNFDRAASGKFITIYPRTTEKCEELLRDLADVTRDHDGPHILSDRRYKDSRVVHYRYGGFARVNRIQLTGGKEALIRRTGGEFVADERVPYFKLPAWCVDPFSEVPREPKSPAPGDASPIILNDRYEVEGAIAFSNCGGVYRARDLIRNQRVIIKEARPLTGLATYQGEWMDAVAMLKHEHSILTALAPLGVTPEPVDFFRAWEHSFLVQSYIKGMLLSEYRAGTNIGLLPFDGDADRAISFCTRFARLAVNLLENLEQIHARGVVLADISANNIIVDSDTLSVTLIDMGSAFAEGDSEFFRRIASTRGTPGFTRPGRELGLIQKEDDYYALGILLQSLILPVEALYSLNPSAQRRFLRRASRLARLPSEVGVIVNALVRSDRRAAKRALRTLIGDASRPPRAGLTNAVATAPRDAAQTIANLNAILHGLKMSFVESADFARTDRLWPCDYQAFVTNPASLAYGACGPALLLADESSELTCRIRRWFEKAIADTNSLPPGLYVGLAGVAYTLMQIGDLNWSEKVAQTAFDSPLLRKDCTVLFGAAGCGILALKLHTATRNQRYLDQAVVLGQQVIDAAVITENRAFWTNPADSHLHYGFGYGSAGIALFLLYLHVCTGERRFLHRAQQALAGIMIGARMIDGKASWGRYENDHFVLPYWLDGCSGIGTTFIRFAHHLNDPEYLRCALAIADQSFQRLTVWPGQFEGMSGLGEYLLDVWQYTGLERYRWMAFSLSESICCFCQSDGSRRAFPGRGLVRLSHDYAYGGSGVGLFFRRLVKNEPRMLHEVDIGVTHLAASVPSHVASTCRRPALADACLLREEGYNGRGLQ